MRLVDQINADIKSAMLAKEKEKLATLRDIKSKLMLEATSGKGEVTDEKANKIVLKLYKQRMETYELYKEKGREDLAKDEQFQASIIEAYLPKMLSETEIEAKVKETIAQIGANSMADIGKVMGKLSAELAGKADGKIIATIVKRELG